MRQTLFSLTILLFVSLNASAQQPTTPEELAFNAVSMATNPASRMAAAEDFVANFPKSSKRQDVVKLVSEQLSIIRNPSIAVTLLERAQAIFTSANELSELNPAAFEVYFAADRVDQAFGVGGDILSRKPYEFWVLVKLTNLGAKEARSKNIRFADAARRYALRAIQIIERNERESGVSDEEWQLQKAQLPLLHQQVGIINLAEGNTREAKEYLNKAVALDQRDASNFGLLGRVLQSEYERRTSLFNNMPEGTTKVEEKKQLEALIDEVINTYARAAGLATGKVKYQMLLQQVIPDLTNLYRVRYQSTVGLRELIEKYRQ
jgi:tetratricopeptide (TPR) repeat protein